MKPIIKITVGGFTSHDDFKSYAERTSKRLSKDYHVLIYHNPKIMTEQVELIEPKYIFMNRWKFRLVWSIITLISLSIWALIINLLCN